MNKSSHFHPIVFAIILCVGILIGSFLNKNSSSQMPNKFDLILNQLDEIYIDSIDKNELIEQAVQYVIEELDPHSSYIPAKNLQTVNEGMEGSFDGIGIEFNIQKDTLLVVAPISGGPSQMVGVLSGDKIIRVDEEVIAGINITNDDIFKLLRGKKGTKVSIDILRNGEVINFEIIRDKIPIYSVDVSYMIENSLGYIKINRFSATTYEEFITASAELLNNGMKTLVLDLRNNPGGYLGASINISNEFLPDNKLIVYTQSRDGERQEYYSNKNGLLINTEVIVIIDEGSASASEIVSGALQDNDRGTIVGRRSFGKGLVQEQFQNKDGSAYRITTQRYYTPTGRCIQRPYSKGDNEQYQEDILDRYSNGELLSKDSIPLIDSLKYVTPKGKIVYGGGGIIPDVFIPIDTTSYHQSISTANRKGLVQQFAYSLSDQLRKDWGKKDVQTFISDYEVNEATLLELKAYCKTENVDFPVREFDTYDLKIIRTQLKAFIGRTIWNDEAFFPIMHQIDNTFQGAIKQ